MVEESLVHEELWCKGVVVGKGDDDMLSLVVGLEIA
jgi:hypothetical protein